MILCLIVIIVDILVIGWNIYRIVKIKRDNKMAVIKILQNQRTISEMASRVNFYKD